MLFDKNQMSADEWQFIRAYCYAVQKHYDWLQQIRVLMNPDWFNVKCPTTATRLAQKLNTLHDEFANTIDEIGIKHASVKAEKQKTKRAKPEQVAEVFTLSFFKIIDPHLKTAFLADKNMPKHDGWSSGHPSDWQQTLKSLQDIYKQKIEQRDGPVGPFLQALLKLFAAMPNKSWSDDDLEAENDYDDEYDDYEEYGSDSDDADDDPMSFFM